MIISKEYDWPSTGDKMHHIYLAPSFLLADTLGVGADKRLLKIRTITCNNDDS